MLNLQQVDLRNKRVIVRADLNVAVSDGEVSSDQRIRASLETIRYALDANASVCVLSHLGRPKEGKFEQKYSLAPVRAVLESLLDQEVGFLSDWIEGIDLRPGQAALCENVRFLQGETQGSDALSRQMAQSCDVFVMDAFATAHRNHASTCGIVKHVPVACAGALLQREIDSLDQALENPKSPVVSIVGGAKVEGKLQIIENLCKISESMIVGGGIANTFLTAVGKPIGNSLHEPRLVEQAKAIVQTAKRHRCNMPLPVDAIVGADYDADGAGHPADDDSHPKEWSEGELPDGVYRTPFCQPYTRTAEKNVAEVCNGDKILDIGPTTAENYARLLAEAGTIIWNGPVGAFEHEPFAHGTGMVAKAVAQSRAYSVAGGGDTIAALERFDCMESISYVSTGGGAFLEYVQGAALPAIEALQQHQIGFENRKLAG